MTVAGGVHIGSHIIGINAHDVAQRRVALQRKIFLEVVYIKDGLGRIRHPPHDGDADLHRVAQAIIDFLAGIVQRHDLQRDPLVAAHLHRSLRTLRRQHDACGLAAVHIAGLVQLGLCGGVEGRAEGIYKVKARALQRADIFSEQRQHQRFLGLEHLQAAEGDKADHQPQDAHAHGDHPQGRGAVLQARGAENHQADGGQIKQEKQKQHCHAVFLPIQNLFVHIDTSF